MPLRTVESEVLVGSVASAVASGSAAPEFVRLPECELWQPTSQLDTGRDEENAPQEGESESIT